MFGFGKKAQPGDDQIPYEIYETLHAPAARRRRWIVRLLAALVVATALVFGVVTWRNRNDTNQPRPADPSASQQKPAPQNAGPAQQNPVGQPSRQAPQSNAPVPKPETPPAAPDSSVNTGTVNRPD